MNDMDNQKLKLELDPQDVGLIQQFLGVAAKHPESTLQMQMKMMELVSKLGSTQKAEEPSEANKTE